VSEHARQLPRLALTRAEAAEALGMSLDSFERYVQADVRMIRRGRMRLVPVRELERWLDANAATVLVELRGSDR
jgi:helix-turn-helix protein